MSATIQGAPTASMTVASGRAGIFPIGFGYLPPEGSRCVMAQYDWTAQTGYADDLSQLVARGVETSIQSVFVDNSSNAQPVSILVNGTNHLIVTPARSQGFYPIFFTGAPGFQITVGAAAAALTRLYLLNLPCNGAVWSTV